MSEDEFWDNAVSDDPTTVTQDSKFSTSSGVKDQTHHNDGTKKAADAAALKNAAAAAGGSKEKATLVLRGYPGLKAKTTLEITGVGAGSGVWYCKRVVQHWHVNHGYITNVAMTRGGGGSSGKGGSNPSGETVNLG